MVILLMGVSGCGKSTIGQMLAKALGRPFVDGDAVHSSRNVAKMRRGRPLTEADRRRWLLKLSKQIGSWLEDETDAILACSALTKKSRTILGAARPDVRVVWLRGSRRLIRRRLESRRGHYMPASLLDSQFQTLQAPHEALKVDIKPSPLQIVQTIRSSLRI